MTSVTIDGNRVSTYDAIRWASNEFGNSFKIQNQFPGQDWRFDFETAAQATHFALKWA
jgi:hypothetical protein